MRKILVRAATVVFVLSMVASACGADAPGSPAAAVDPGTPNEEPAVADIEPEPETTTTSITEETETATTVPAEALAFQDEDEFTGHQIWDDVQTVSLRLAIEFDADPTLEISGGFTSGEGATLRWEDPVEGDILAMYNGEQVLRAFRVGNEVFIADQARSDEQQQRDPFGPLFFGDIVAEAVLPLDDDELPVSAGVFVTSEDGRSEFPDVYYELPPDETEGRILVGGAWEIGVTDLGSTVRYEIPEAGVVLTREEVGNFTNNILRQWYLDQSG